MISFCRIQAVVLRGFYDLRHSPERIFDTFFWPFLDLVVWGFVTVYIKDISQINIMSVILGALVFWVILYSFSRDFTLTMLLEVWDKNLYNLFASPIKPIEVILGATFIAFIKSLGVMLLLFITMASFYDFFVWDIGALLFMSLLNIFLFAAAFGIFTSSVIYRFGMRAQMFCWGAIFVIHPFLCIFYPLKTLPEYLQYVAYLLSPMYVFEFMRNFLQTGVVPEMYDWMVPVGLNGVYFVVVVVMFWKSFMHARRRGWFIKMD